ncbi:hypothetical protein BDV93DRAFT_586032 [Ceratobasidium sp. AG-I]|nr:hypothetical protein BDV93DRAFT_586032 [Ceratobasidium sp. AG-I]
MSETCPAGDVSATFNYALPNPDGKSLYLTQLSTKASNFRINFFHDPRNVLVQDLRGRENDFSLDVNGFEYLTHHTLENFLNKESIAKNYCAEMQRLIGERTGANQVVVLGHRISVLTLCLSLFQCLVHVDRTPESVAAEIRACLGEDAERLLQGRVRFVNAWRPIGQAAHHEPLAVVDWQTSPDASNLLPLYFTNVESAFDQYISRFDKKHKWYYLGHQTPSEVALIKCYDSCPDGGANFCLHSAFQDPRCHANAPRRRSIEVNTLVFG